MSGRVADRKRLLRVTAGNLRNDHIYITGHYDFFPSDCIGPSRRSAKGNGHAIEILLEGLNETVETDIGRSAKNGKPRNFLRGRGWVREFFKHHGTQPGDVLALEKIASRSYRLYPQVTETNGGGKAYGAGKRRARTPRFTAAEFFAGIGLVRLALERQGWSVVFANDIDPDKAEMYRHNWPNDDHLVLGDIHELKAADVPDCDLFTASFPCNDLSIAGRWDGLNGKESSAFWGLVRIIREMRRRRPPLVMLENVVGFLMSHGGRDFEQALLALNELGYAVDAFILNANCWTPQSRPRLFVVARHDDGHERQPFAMESDARPDPLVRFIYLHQNIRWDIRKLPRLPKSRKRLVDILEDLPDDDPHWWEKERAEYFMNQLSTKHEAEARRMIGGRSYTYATAFRRVRRGRSMAEIRTDGVAGCLRTPRGGSGRQILLKAGRGKYQVRLLTARECARLQGVPNSYRIDVPLNQALFGFGDAVCVPAVEWITTQYLTPVVASLRRRATPFGRIS